MVILSQASPKNDESYAEQNLRLFTDSARLCNCAVYYVPTDWDQFSPDDVLAGVRAPEGSPCVFVGYINDNAYYEALCASAEAMGLRMINSPEQSTLAMEFPLYYDRVADLTAESVIVENDEQLAQATALGWPLFVKGAIKSNKEGGWAACVVESEADLADRWDYFKRRPITARNTMVARKVMPLRKSGAVVGGFPEAREYRCFLFRSRMIGFGYYWSKSDPFGPLSSEDAAAVEFLAGDVARRIGCPLMAVDVGQLEDGDWVLVEAGDLQYSGVSQMSHMVFWERLRHMLGEGGT